MHISHHLMSILHFTLACCCEPEVGVFTVSAQPSTISQLPSPSCAPSLSFVLWAFSVLSIPTSSSSSSATYRTVCCVIPTSVPHDMNYFIHVRLALNRALCVLFAVCSIPTFLFSFPASPYSLPLLSVPPCLSSLTHLSCLLFILSASPVFWERVCLHKWPLHCWALEVRWGPRLCRWFRWGITSTISFLLQFQLWHSGGTNEKKSLFWSRMAVMWSVTVISFSAKMATASPSAGVVTLMLIVWMAAMRRNVTVAVRNIPFFLYWMLSPTYNTEDVECKQQLDVSALLSPSFFSG